MFFGFGWLAGLVGFAGCGGCLICVVFISLLFALFGCGLGFAMFEFSFGDLRFATLLLWFYLIPVASLLSLGLGFVFGLL